jgi:hypothetical protein
MPYCVIIKDYNSYRDLDESKPLRRYISKRFDQTGLPLSFIYIFFFVTVKSYMGKNKVLHVTPPPKTPQGVHFFRWVYIREKS